MTPSELRRAIDRLATRTQPRASGPDPRESLRQMFAAITDAHERAGGWRIYDADELAQVYTEHLARIVAEIDTVRDKLAGCDVPGERRRLADHEAVLVFVAGRLANGADRALNDAAAGRLVVVSARPVQPPSNMSTVDLIALAECA